MHKVNLDKIPTGGVSSSFLLSDSGLADIFENTPSVETGNMAGVVCEVVREVVEEEGTSNLSVTCSLSSSSSSISNVSPKVSCKSLICCCEDRCCVVLLEDAVFITIWSSFSSCKDNY